MKKSKVIYLNKSNKPDKKYMIQVDNKTTHFGSKGMSDYTLHKDKDRMKRYIARHGGNKNGTESSREDWKCSGLKTAGFWSRWLLWSSPSLNEAKRTISKKCNIEIKSGLKQSKKSLKKSLKKSKKSLKKSKKSLKKRTKKRTKKSLKKSLKNKK